MEKAEAINYSGIFFSCYAKGGTNCVNMVRDHTLTYIYSGELEIDNNGEKHVLGKNQCVFIKRDHRVQMIKKTKGDEPYWGISLVYQRNDLREFYHKLDKSKIPGKPGKKDLGFAKMDAQPDIISLFESLKPYLNSDVAPLPQVIELKKIEGIYALLHADEAYFPILFDFTDPWKIDLMQFMNDNYMYDLSMGEFASFTGRSLATFKRDFSRISDLPPQKWIIRRRLEAAYDIIRNKNRKASDVYLEVGFKDITHFYHAFKKQYGFTPGK